MVVKFMGFNFVKMGGSKQRGYTADDTVLIGNSEEDSRNVCCFLVASFVLFVHRFSL